MENIFEEGSEWVASSLFSARMEHAALQRLLASKKIITNEEYMNELNEVLSDDYVYSVRAFVAQSERQLRDGPWHIGGAAATDQLARRLRLDPEDIVLDVGCGIGGPARQLVETFGCEVVGVDYRHDRVVEAMLRTAALNLGDRVVFQVGEGERLPFKDEEFDAVFSQGTWNHVPDKRSLIREAVRVLKTGGRLGVEFEALTDEAQVEPDDTQDTVFRISKWISLIETAGLQEIELNEMWEETRRFYSSGPQHERVDRGELVGVRIVARKI